ncbi:MAG: 50S ribosomal protein L32e [Methanomicrobiaceae archaeon]|uniref:Large ribosomal subunit protein eL32 n=1 Tax=hydrocarbon metagenome TaxID=938273 RepID=A0A0W8FHN1_9ZZZZ|nr:50S ribosomal protein L32e [Methanomicrobiaceae archaeon]MDD5418296.1 50S ribosomal protein L32e [Methanomicrobiaceae archaeon]
MEEKRRLIRLRARHNRPKFKRRGLGQKKRLEDTWRRPRGLHNKQRRQIRAKGGLPGPGYGSPAAVRGLHPSGYEEVLVFSPAELAGLNPETQAVRIGGTVGGRKRATLQEQALQLGLKILNPRDLAAASEEEVSEDE